MLAPQAPCTEPAWTRQSAKGTAPSCEKPWENQGFLAKRSGTELLSVFSMFLTGSKGKKDGWSPKKKFDSRSFLFGSSQPCLMFLSGVHHTKNKNLKLANVVEDDERKAGNRPVPQTVINRRTPIGICCQFERRGFHAFKEFHSQPNLMSVVPVRGRHYIRMKTGMVSNLVLTVRHL